MGGDLFVERSSGDPGLAPYLPPPYPAVATLPWQPDRSCSVRAADRVPRQGSSGTRRGEEPAMAPQAQHLKVCGSQACLLTATVCRRSWVQPRSQV